MTAFATAVKNSNNNEIARTANNMKALKTTSDACVDLFYAVGSSRGKNIIPTFVKAFVEDQEVAVRIALWARDARGGAGERETFRKILNWLSINEPDVALRIVRSQKISELGRWDDYLSVDRRSLGLKEAVFSEIENGFCNPETVGLVSKWMPRQGKDAAEFRSWIGISPKHYRKLLVRGTNVVETKMCARDWQNINYSHVPSVASARYQKAFSRHDPEGYSAWRDGLSKGETKVNASVLYPYDVIRSLKGNGDAQVSLAQWESLPNYVGDGAILPLVDVSGSMTCPASGKITCLDVALSLGLYLADKNMGCFKDTFLTFSATPQLLHLKGNLLHKMNQMERSEWGMNTNLNAAIEKILSVAIKGSVSPDEMPKILLVLSDMQFDQCIRHDDSAMEMIERKYENAGYRMPKVVFWCLNAAYKNAPVKSTKRNVALVSGFSPAIMTSILAGKDFSPVGIMRQTVMTDRYSF